MHSAVSEALSTEDDMLNAIETAECNFADFYWCSKRCSFSCYGVVTIEKNGKTDKK